MAKNENTAVMVRFDTTDEKQAFDTLANHYGMSSSQAIKTLTKAALNAGYLVLDFNNTQSPLPKEAQRQMLQSIEDFKDPKKVYSGMDEALEFYRKTKGQSVL